MTSLMMGTNQTNMPLSTPKPISCDVPRHCREVVLEVVVRD